MGQKDFLLFSYTDQIQIPDITNPINQSRVIEVSPFNLKWIKKIIECGGGLDILKLLLISLFEIIFIFDPKERLKIFLYIVKDTVAHYSVVQAARYHLRGMKHKEKEIGFCYTHEKFRGKGIYPFVLISILKELNKVTFMIVHKDNTPSIKGIEKAGFQYARSLNRVQTIYFYPRYM